MLDLTKVSNTSRALLCAAQYIREVGWCQGRFVDDTGRVCLVGAMSDVGLHPGGMRALNRKLFGQSLMEWNDAPGRTQEQVIELLEELAWELADVTEA